MCGQMNGQACLELRHRVALEQLQQPPRGVLLLGLVRQVEHADHDEQRAGHAEGGRAHICHHQIILLIGRVIAVLHGHLVDHGLALAGPALELRRLSLGGPPS